MAINVHLGGKVYSHSDSSFGANYINPHEKRTKEVVVGLTEELSKLKKDVEDLKGQVSANKNNIHQLNAFVVAEKGSLSSRIETVSVRSRLSIYDLSIRSNWLGHQVNVLNQAVFNPMHWNSGY